MAKHWRGVIEEYKKFLPVSKKTPVITLEEGDTPLIKSDRLAREIGFKGVLWLKFEGANPTGSFKDRGMTLAVSKAAEEGSKAVICASTGNTLASAAAYSARAGIKCIGILPQGRVAAGKLVQALVHGAEVVQVRGNFDEAASLVYEIAENYPVKLVNSLNPHRIEGQKTAAFEICDKLKSPPGYHFIPVGNGGNITAYWTGYEEWCERENRKLLFSIGLSGAFPYRIFDLEIVSPRMMGYQAEGAAPIAKGRPISNPETVATAIRVGNPAKWKGALEAANKSGGKIDFVADNQIIESYELIPKLSGIGCEPASAASVAGLAKAVRARDIENSENTIAVCTLTGHILKDPDTAKDTARKPVVLDADLRGIVEFLKL